MSLHKDKVKLIIGLCDDEMNTHNTVENLLADYAVLYDLNIRIIHYTSAAELLGAGDDLDFLFLDIDMPKMDGIEAAHKLRDRGIEYKIIMLTAREDRYREAFKIQAFRFVPKPIEKTELYGAINDVREHIVGISKVSVFRDGVSYDIVQRDILYVEADKSATLIFTRGNEYRSEQTLASWRDVLDDRVFFQCHKSFIVNMGKIEHIEKNVIYMVNGDKVAVSRRLHTPLMNAYMEYDTRRR